jgi:hypothetical protein
MANFHIVYFSSLGVPSTGLTPTWNSLKNVSDGTDYTPQPTISAIGGGWYKFTLDLDSFDHVVGVIDGGGTLANADRYKNFEVSYASIGVDQPAQVVITPVYDEDSVSLSFTVALLIAGRLAQTGLTSVELKMYDESHTLLHTISTNSFTNGVAILVENSPTITKNHSYYVVATYTTEVGTIISAETFLALE